MSIAPFPLLALPSWIDDSSRKPCLLDLAERVMICSPGVLQAFSRRSPRSSFKLLSQVCLSFSTSTCFSICSLSPTKSFPPILFRFDHHRAVGFSMLEYASCPLRLSSAGYNLVKYPSISFSLFFLFLFLFLPFLVISTMYQKLRSLLQL